MDRVVIPDSTPPQEYPPLVHRPAGCCTKSGVKTVCESAVFANSKHRVRLEVQTLALDLITLCNPDDPARRLLCPKVNKQFIIRDFFIFRSRLPMTAVAATGRKHIIRYFHTTTSFRATICSERGHGGSFSRFRQARTLLTSHPMAAAIFESLHFWS